MLNFSSAFLFALGSLTLSACGVESNTSNLKAPPSQVYRFNANGSGAALKAWNTQLPDCGSAPCRTVNADGTMNVGALNSNLFFVFGPYLNFEPGPSGIGHLDAQVVLEGVGEPSGDRASTVAIDLVANAGTLILDSKTVTFKKSEGIRTISLHAEPFTAPLSNVEVRVYDLHSLVVAPVFGHPQVFRGPALKIHETRIIYN